MLLLDFPSIESVPETTEDSMDEYEAGLMVPRGGKCVLVEPEQDGEDIVTEFQSFRRISKKFKPKRGFALKTSLQYKCDVKNMSCLPFKRPIEGIWLCADVNL